MRLPFTLGLLLLMSPIDLGAQAPASARPSIRIGLGFGSTDYSCSECEIDPVSGVAGFIAAGHPLGRLLEAGLEAALADAGSGNAKSARLLGVLATAGVRGKSRLPLWATVGLGWAFWFGSGPNANGPALSVRGGVDLPLGAGLALSPFAGYTVMLGHDGPAHVRDPIVSRDGVPTRLSSVQLGVAATLGL